MNGVSPCVCTHVNIFRVAKQDHQTTPSTKRNNWIMSSWLRLYDFCKGSVSIVFRAAPERRRVMQGETRRICNLVLLARSGLFSCPKR
jgi:hypothetical protein